MTPFATIRRAPKPSQLAAGARRRAVAEERVKAAMAGLLDGLDHETRMETCRTGIRVLAKFAKQDGGEGRASGVLCGALADVAPGYRAEARTEAEAVFRREESE